MSDLKEPLIDLEKVELTFEEAMQRIEQIVRLIESNTMSLNETLASFEEGVKLTRFCQNYLESAEKRIEQVILTADGSIKQKEFKPQEPDHV